MPLAPSREPVFACVCGLFLKDKHSLLPFSARRLGEKMYLCALKTHHKTQEKRI
jgi:hypothetical protein